MSADQESYVDQVLAGAAEPDSIHAFVHTWHATRPAGLPLYEFLGMRRYDYERLVNRPESLPTIIDEYRARCA